MLIKNKFLFKNGLEIDEQLISNLISGTAPLVINSNTLVTNLNADLLDGSHASEFVKYTDSFYIGNTQISLNRSSSPITLSGILSIDGSSSSLTINRNISITGDGNWNVSFNGSSDVSSVFTLSNTSVVPGTYNKVTVDSKGRITFGENVDLLSSVSWNDIKNKPTTLTEYGIDNDDIGQLISLTPINWNKITNKPTTISGYGIEDAVMLVDGKIPTTLLPQNYIDEVQQYPTVSDFPTIGNVNVIYLNTGEIGKYYRWVSNPNRYINMTDLLQSSSVAEKLLYARDFTIGFTKKSFDGSGDVSWTVRDILGNSKTYIGTSQINIFNENPQYNLTLGISVSGNSATATKLYSSKTITIGSTSKQFDGNNDVSWTLEDIGAASKFDLLITSFETYSTSNIRYVNGNIVEIVYTNGSKKVIDYINGRVSSVSYYKTDGITLISTQYITYSQNGNISNISWITRTAEI